jgi:GR25 family glycosyltransferase involved in LPS biosynthesis
MKLNKIDKSFFINLDRRVDRLDHINKNLPFDAVRFSAVDANNLDLNEQVENLFHRCLDKLTKAEIACSLSHYMLWKQLTEDDSSENYLILEDDVVFKDGFTQFWNHVYSNYLPEDYNLIYLGGCQPWNKPHYGKILKSHNEYFCTVRRNNFFTKDDHYFHMNAQSYIISKRAAQLMCDHLERFGFDLKKGQGQDIFMVKFFDNNPKSILHLNPLMSYQIHEENDNIEKDKNSDIRSAEEKFGEEKIKEKIDKISVIIPTVWMANDFLVQSLLELDKNDSVLEVIVINNKTSNTPRWINSFQKVRVIKQEPGLYFNASVNLAVPLCRSNICCIFNDDITVDQDIFKFVIDNYNKESGCMFISPDSINSKTLTAPELKEHPTWPPHGSGMLMFFNQSHFTKIPKQLVHHFGDNFIFSSFFALGFRNYLIKGFAVNGLTSASQTSSVFPTIREDWRVHKEVFENMTYYTKGSNYEFPKIKTISNKEIPKKIHLSWRNKNVLDSDYELIKKGAKNLQILNPDWDIEVYDDEDINKCLRDSLNSDDWELIKNKKITEKTDLWRLLKTYKEGGLYIDIDRYIDTPISEIINPETTCVLPTYQDVDFSQDFILTCPANPIIEKAIANNIKYRKEGKPLFFTGVYSYMRSVCEMLQPISFQGLEKLDWEKAEQNSIPDRGDNPEYFNDIREKINACKHMKTYRESGPENHILYRNINKDFNIRIFEKDKADFYNGEKVIHWNTDTQKQHEALQVKSSNEPVSLNSKKESFMKLASMWPNFLDKPKGYTKKTLPVVDWLTYCDKNISHPQPDKGLFSCYNGGKEIAIVMMYTPNIYDFAVYSEKSIRQYAEHQGYTLYVYRDNLNKSQHPNWSKPQALLNHIGGHSHVIWMDSDTLIFNPEKKFSDIIDKYSNKYIIACKDIGGENGSLFNSGVLIFKNHQYIKNLITRWRDFNCDKSSLYSSGGDQEVLCNIVKRSDSTGFNRKILPSSAFNTDPRLVNNDTFILHFMAYPATLKKIFMSYWHSE